MEGGMTARRLAAEWLAGDEWEGREVTVWQRGVIESLRCARFERLARRAIVDGVHPVIVLEAYDIATGGLAGRWRQRVRESVEAAGALARGGASAKAQRGFDEVPDIRRSV